MAEVQQRIDQAIAQQDIDVRNPSGPSQALLREFAVAGEYQGMARLLARHGKEFFAARQYMRARFVAILRNALAEKHSSSALVAWEKDNPDFADQAIAKAESSPGSFALFVDAIKDDLAKNSTDAKLGVPATTSYGGA